MKEAYFLLHYVYKLPSKEVNSKENYNKFNDIWTHDEEKKKI